MSEDVFVSVIMPCYNSEKFLDDSLNSLMNQTFKNFEVICINDGSTDGTLQKLSEWKEKNVLNMVVLNQENAGVSSSRNRGIKIARGELVVFLDADDMFSKQYMEFMVEGIKDKDSAYCRITRDVIENQEDFILSIVTENSFETMEKMLSFPRNYNFTIYIYRTELLKKNALLFDINTKFGEDREFIWKYLSFCKNIAFIDLPMYYYRPNEQSVSRHNISWRKTDTLKAMKRVEMHLKMVNSPFSNRFEEYMFPRTMWHVAKTFAIANDKKLYKQLREEYDVISCMKRTAKDKELLVAISSFLYLIHPMLFYYSVSLKRK